MGKDREKEERWGEDREKTGKIWGKDRGNMGKKQRKDNEKTEERQGKTGKIQREYGGKDRGEITYARKHMQARWGREKAKEISLRPRNNSWLNWNATENMTNRTFLCVLFQIEGERERGRKGWKEGRGERRRKKREK